MNAKLDINVHRSAQRVGQLTAADSDPITTEIIRHALNSAAKQMKRAMIRTSFSPIIYEALDFAVVLYDRDCRLLSQGMTLPIFMGTMGFCIEGAVKAVGGETRRVIPIHEERLKDRFPTRVTKHGLHVTEICLADGETSKI